MKTRFAKFALVGLLGVTLQLALLQLLTQHLHMTPVTATILAVELTILHNFLWHEHFTWPFRTTKRFHRLCRFHLSNGLVSLGGNALLTYYLVDHLKAPQLPSAIASISICALANFAFADRWVFSQ